MTQVRTITLRGKRSFAITDASNGQTIKVLSVDGDILSTTVTNTTAVITASKNGSNKNYVYNLNRAILERVYSS